MLKLSTFPTSIIYFFNLLCIDFVTRTRRSYSVHKTNNIQIIKETYWFGNIILYKKKKKRRR